MVSNIFFIFTPILGEESPFCPNIFANELVQPPTRLLGFVKGGFLNLSTIVNRLWKITILENMFCFFQAPNCSNWRSQKQFGVPAPYFWGCSFWGSKNANLFSPQELKEVHVLLVHVKAWGEKQWWRFFERWWSESHQILECPVTKVRIKG